MGVDDNDLDYKSEASASCLNRQASTTLTLQLRTVLKAESKQTKISEDLKEKPNEPGFERPKMGFCWFPAQEIEAKQNRRN